MRSARARATRRGRRRGTRGLAALRTSGRRARASTRSSTAVVEHLPEGPSFYPEDDLTDRPLRFLAAELVREAAFECLEQEVPYGVAVEIRSFDESRPDLVRIAADLLVERASQKGIVLGRGGAMIKRDRQRGAAADRAAARPAGLPRALGEARRRTGRDGPTS